MNMDVEHLLFSSPLYVLLDTHGNHVFMTSHVDDVKVDGDLFVGGDELPVGDAGHVQQLLAGLCLRLVCVLVREVDHLQQHNN